MLSAAALVLPAAAVDEAKAYLRVGGTDEDELLMRLLVAAAELGEQFIRQALIERAFGETLAASRSWTRLGIGPVLAISGIEALAADGSASALAADAYAIDVDSAGDGWVRLTAPVESKRVRVAFEAGLAAEWADLAEALRQGVVRLAAHFYTHRNGEGGAAPPAAATALLRPWRRLRLR